MRFAFIVFLTLGIASPASAVVVQDTYWGGLNTYNPSNGDVIGDASVFDIKSMEVTRVGSALHVTVHTPYAGMAGTNKALGTGYGALFFSTTGVTLNASKPNYGKDQYTPGRFNYAFVIPENPGSGNRSGSYLAGSMVGGLFALKADGTDVELSNANGSSVTYPLEGNANVYIRQGQAVQFINDGENKAKAKAGGSWSVDSLNDTISFIIQDNNLLGNSFTISWTMTCGNDVILGNVVLQDPGPGPGPDPVPLPAAFMLFAGGAAVIGAVSRRRQHPRKPKRGDSNS
jgi:hypothetical protein